VLGDPVNFVDPSGLKKGFGNPGICATVVVIGTGETIQVCRDIVQDAYNDYIWQRNKDYEKICPGTPASPIMCVAGCYIHKFWD